MSQSVSIAPDIMLLSLTRLIKLAYKHFQRALAQWPKDILRPQVSFQKSMQQRIDRHFSPSDHRLNGKEIKNDALTTVPSALKVDETAELEQANVLYSFLENRYTKKVSIST